MHLVDVLENAAVNDPSAVALTVPGGERSTFAELREQVARLEAVVRARTGPGARVAILSDNTPVYVRALYAVPAADATLVLLNYRLHPREWAEIVARSGARLVLVHTDFEARLAEAFAEAGYDGEILTFDDAGGGTLAAAEAEVPATTARAARPASDQAADLSPAWIIYTSGTTGFPKGAQISHRGILRASFGHLLESGVDRDATFLMSFPMCHASAYQIVMFHLRTVNIVLPRAFEPALWLRLVQEHRVTHTGLAPTMFSFVLDHPDAPTTDTSSLRQIGYGGMPMPVTTARRAIERFGPVLATGFGSTETTGLTTWLSPGDHVRALAGDGELLRSCGRPMGHVAVTVLDENLAPVPTGEIGELMVRGDQTMLGYLDDPAATAAATAGGWVHTGDLARLDADGYVHLVDRRNDMIISGGQNVYPVQVEQVLYQHPAVREAAVVGLPDELWGQTVTAAVSLTPGAGAPAAELIAFCRDRLAGYKTPRAVHILPELPKNATGKIMRRLVRDQLTPGAAGEPVGAPSRAG